LFVSDATVFAKKGSRHAKYSKMKLDYVAVAALVGSYSMVPPLSDHWGDTLSALSAEGSINDPT
jgi:hypothetical protein